MSDQDALACASSLLLTSVWLEHVDQVLAIMKGIADQPLVHRIDNQIELLQRNVPDQHRSFVGQGRNVQRRLAPHDG